MPSTPARNSDAFSIRSVLLASMPECDSAMTMSAPSSFICGTQAAAVSTMSRVMTLPVRFLESQIMICGGTKPMKPTRTACSAPDPSFTVRSRIT